MSVKKFISQLVPFLIAGIIIVALAFGLVLLAYLFLFGAIVGFILFALTWVKHKLFTPKKLPTTTTAQKKSGRIIDSDDWKEL